MSIERRQYENTPEEIKKVRNRIKAYLKERNGNVSRDELLRVAGKAKIKRSLIYDATKWIENLEDFDDCDISHWWGYENAEAVSENPAEQKKAWFRYYELDKEWKDSLIRGFEHFETLDDEIA